MLLRERRFIGPIVNVKTALTLANATLIVVPAVTSNRHTARQTCRKTACKLLSLLAKAVAIDGFF
jgi:hypothetical protein